MKFACERCQTRYSIGDEKVRGKVLKIRCKTCGNIIVVREQTQAAGVSAAPAAQAAASGSTGSLSGVRAPVGATGPLPPVPKKASVGVEIEWFVAIKGKQHGPATKEDIARLFREARITERTYLWNEGMAAWTRLKDVPEFSMLLTEPTSRRPPPPPPPTDEGAEIVNFEQARQQRMGISSHGATGVPTHDPFAAVAGNNLVGGDNAPRDSTRVFIMQAGLANRGQRHKMYAGISVAVVSVLFTAMFLDYRGVIEIPGLHSVVNVVTQKVDPTPNPIPAVAFGTGEEDPELKCKLMPNPEECKKQVRAENEQKRKKRAAYAPAGSAGMDDINAGFAINGPGGEGNLKVGTTGPSGFSDKSNTDEAARIAAILKTGGKGGPSAPKAKMETPSVSGSSLDAENVGKVVRDGAGAVQTCVEREAKNGNLPTGKQRLVVTVQPKGTVSEARFTDGATSASPVGECIRGAAKRWKFAPFPGEATDLEIPLILSVSM